MYCTLLMNSYLNFTTGPLTAALVGPYMKQKAESVIETLIRMQRTTCPPPTSKKDIIVAAAQGTTNISLLGTIFKLLCQIKSDTCMAKLMPKQAQRQLIYLGFNFFKFFIQSSKF